MLTSMGSRSSRSTRKSSASLTAHILPGRPGPARSGARAEPSAGDRRRSAATVASVPAVGFPDRFLWGTATAAHQIEGGNVNNDWWAIEHDPTSGCVDVSGDACDSFNRYPEDIALVADLGLGRLPVLPRVEPHRARGGRVLRVALDHYRRMAATCHEHGILPVVTFHHFTHPRWLAAAGTWEALHAPDRFARYCERVTAHLGDLIGMACTLNEPNVVATMGWRLGIFPPRVRDRTRRDAVNAAMVSAHRKAVEAIRSGPGGLPGGHDPVDDGLPAPAGGEAWLERMRGPNEDVFLEATGGDDFIGVQTYTRMRVGPDGALPAEDGVAHDPDGLRGLARGPRGHHPAGLGGDRRGAGLRHRERHRHRRRRRADRVRDPGPGRGAPVPRRRDRRPRLLLLEPAGQLRVGARLRPHLRAGRGGPGPPSSAGPSPARPGSGAWPGPTASR